MLLVRAAAFDMLFHQAPTAWHTAAAMHQYRRIGQHVVERLVLNRGTQNASGAFTSACMQPHAYMMAAVPRAGLHMAMTSQLVTSL
jgi:hypothetical protein